MKKVNFFLSALLALIITSSMVFMPVLADDLTVYSEWNFSDKKVGENTGYTPNGLTAAVADAGGGAPGSMAKLTKGAEPGGNMILNSIKEAALSDDFIMETSLKIGAGSSLYFGIRSSEKIAGFNENAFFEFVGNKIKVGHKSSIEYSNPTVSYEEDKWYHVAIVYHKESNSFDLYLNCKKVYENIATQIDTAKVDRMNIWHAANNGYIGFRYIRIYKGSDINIADYIIPDVTSKSPETVVNGDVISTRCENIEKLKTQLENAETARFYTVNSDGVYTEITGNSVESGVMIVTSANGMMFKAYTVKTFVESLEITQEQNEPGVNVSVQFRNGGEAVRVRLLTLAYKNGVFVSARQTIKEVTEDCIMELSGEYESGIELTALITDINGKPLSSKMYNYVVK